MDEHRFDTVAKALGSDTSRRRILRGLLAGTGGGALAHLLRHDTAAAPCGAGELRCGNRCYTPIGACPTNPQDAHCCRGCPGGPIVSCEPSTTCRCPGT
jgi:hypothetical protein